MFRMKDLSAARLGGLALIMVAAACGESPTDLTAGETGTAAQAVTVPGSHGPAAVQANHARARPLGPADGTGVVTLITGDRVRVVREGNRLVPQVTPGPGRHKVGFVVTSTPEHLMVRPADIIPLLTAGRLDPELFNVTRLLAEGDGDDQRGDLPLLITGQADLPA